jgi:SAM-dependent methyltransferase
MARSNNVLIVLLRRFRRAVQRYGVIGFLRLVLEHTTGFVRNLRSSDRAAMRESERRAAAFDEEFGVETGGFIHPTALNISNPNEVHAVSYSGSDPKPFREAMLTLKVDYRHFVFVDFGSGKGRAILMAAEFPFKSVVGVEFSEELHKIAKANINKFRNGTSMCQDVESVCMDAVDYPIPNSPLVCYFCNPFDATIMAQVLSNIQGSLLRNPRELFIVYYNPKLGYLVDQTDCFRRIGPNGWIHIWTTDLNQANVKKMNS